MAPPETGPSLMDVIVSRRSMASKQKSRVIWASDDRAWRVCFATTTPSISSTSFLHIKTNHILFSSETITTTENTTKKPPKMSTSASSPLLSLPAELRNAIYQDVAVKKNNEVTIIRTSHDHQPGILHACRETRADALLAFYANNTFVVEIIDFDVRPLMGFYEAVMRHSPQPTGDLAAGKVVLRTIGAFKWGNVVEWARRVWREEFWTPLAVAEDDPLSELMSAVVERRHWRWSRVQKWLHAQKYEMVGRMR